MDHRSFRMSLCCHPCVLPVELARANLLLPVAKCVPQLAILACVRTIVADLIVKGTVTSKHQLIQYYENKRQMQG